MADQQLSVCGTLVIAKMKFSDLNLPGTLDLLARNVG